MGPSSVQAKIGSSSPVAVAAAGACQGSACNDPTPGYHSSGYYPSWGMYARQYDAIDIPISHINQIYYAFIGFDADGTLHLLDSNSDGKQLPVIASLLQRYPYLHASLSFGGWTLSGAFSAMANDSTSLAAFVSNVMDALQQTQFDGVDIDWEYPVLNGAPGEPSYSTPQDAEGYANLLVAIRAGLDQLASDNQASGTGPTYYRLSIAGAGGVDKLQTINKLAPTAWARISKAVDVVNVMSYDFHGAFDEGNESPYNVADFMAAMETSPVDPFYSNFLYRQYDVVSPIAMYQELGFTSKQISVGLPAYGRLVMVDNVSTNFGLYQTITGTPSGQYDSTGVFDYRCIQERDCHGYQELPSDMTFINPNDNLLANASHTPWGYSNSTSTFLTYDNAESVQYKVCWAMQQQLFGYMIWDMSGDFPPSDPNSLIGSATAAVLGEC